MITAWITYGRQTVDLGKLPADTYILRAHVHVTQAFTSNANDTLTVGSDSDPDSIITSIDCSSTGIKSVVLGVSAGYNALAQPIKIFYSNSGSEPSAGAALVILEAVKVPDSPV